MRISQITLVVCTRAFGLMLLFFSAASICNASDITYDVNLQIGSASVTGFIVTDGTIGPYYQGTEPPPQFLDWNLLLTDGSITLGDLLGPLSGSNSTANIEDLFGHGMLSATPTQLLYNFGGGYGSFAFSNTDYNCTSNCVQQIVLIFSDEGVPTISGSDGDEIMITTLNNPGAVDSVYQQYTDLSGEQVIGTAESSSSITPEPCTLLLLGTGSALLGFCKSITNKKRHCQS